MKRKAFYTKTLLAILCVCMLTLGFIGIGSTIAYAAEGDLSIAVQPQYNVKYKGEYTDFYVEATGGTAPYTYQWQWIDSLEHYYNGAWSDISGATDATLALEVNKDMEGNLYRCVVTDSESATIISAEAQLFVHNLPTIDTNLSLAAGHQTVLAYTTDRSINPSEYLQMQLISDGQSFIEPYIRWTSQTAPHYFLAVYPSSKFTAMTETNTWNNDSEYGLLVAVSSDQGIVAGGTPIDLYFSQMLTKVNLDLSFDGFTTAPTVSDVRIYCGNDYTITYMMEQITADAYTYNTNEYSSFTQKGENAWSSIVVPQAGVRRIEIEIDETVYIYESADDISLNSGKALDLDLTVTSGNTAVQATSTTESEWITNAIEHTFDSMHECECGATNHTFDSLTDICSCGAVQISATTFPDNNFRSWITDNIAGADDGVLTATELAAVTDICVDYERIADLKGIEHFTEITRLECFNNNLTRLDVSKNTSLKVLKCDVNSLETLDVSMLPLLEELDCSGNELTSLDLRNNTALQYLDCHSNYLTSLDLSSCTEMVQFVGNGQTATISIDEYAEYIFPRSFNSTKVTNLVGATFNGTFVLDNIFGNEVTYTYATGVQGQNLTVTLTVENPHAHNFDATTHYCVCGAAEISATTFPDDIFRDYVTANFDADRDGVLSTAEIIVDSIRIENMDIADLTGIEYFTWIDYLKCCGNQLTSLDVSKNTYLGVLNCEGNQLTSLDVSKNGALESLYCGNNEIASLDLSNNGELWMLGCNNNKLTSLDLRANVLLEELYCQNNRLTSLNLSANTLIQNDYFNASGQTATVTMSCNSLYLTRIDPNFDGSRATSTTTGATFNGDTLVLANDITTVTYTYATGNGSNAIEVTLTIEYVDYGAEIDAIEKELNDAITELNTAINGNTVTLAEIQSAVDTLTAAYEKADEELRKALQGEIAVNTTAITNLQTALTNAESTLDTAIKKVAADLETAKSELNTAIVNGDSALDEKITALDSAYKAADALINGALAELVADDEEMSASITALENSLITVKSELEAAIAQVQKNLDDAKAELEAKDNELEAKDNELAQKDTELKQQLEAQNDKITVLIVILSIVGVVSIGSAALSVITFVKKRKE